MAGDQWFYSKAGSDERHGPVSTAQLKELAAKGELAPDDLIWCEGKTPDWIPAKSAKGLFAASSPPPLPGEKPTGPPPLPANAAPANAERAGRPPRLEVRGASQRQSHNHVVILPAWARWPIGAAATVILLAIVGVLVSRSSPQPPVVVDENHATTRSSPVSEDESYRPAAQPPSAHAGRAQGQPGSVRTPKLGQTGVPGRAPASRAMSRALQAVDPSLLPGVWMTMTPGVGGKNLNLSDQGWFSEFALDVNGTAVSWPLYGRWRVEGTDLRLHYDGTPSPIILGIRRIDGNLMDTVPAGSQGAIRWSREVTAVKRVPSGQRSQHATPQTQRRGTSYDAEHEAKMRALEKYRRELEKRRELQRKAEQISREYLW